jgi:hypothetical protein
MSEGSKAAKAAKARVVTVATGLGSTDRRVPVRDKRHEALGVLIG